MENINIIWQRIKDDHPIGSTLKGKVVEAHPFGIFVDIGYGNRSSKKLTGIIEIVGSNPLPKDTNRWPKIGEEIEEKVIYFRDGSKELDLGLI